MPRRLSPGIALAAAVAVVAAVVLLWPVGDGSTGILERARAVATDGPVVHLILGAEDAHMTEVDLNTGKRRQLQGRHEQWFDPERGFHDLYTVDGRVKQDILYPAGSTPETERQFREFAAAYRKALESGRASVSGKGTFNGDDVYWIRFHVRYPSFGIPEYDADHEVAVDAETFEPRFWRAIPTEKSLSAREATESEIELWETLPAGRGDFTAEAEGNALEEGWGGLSRLGPRSVEQAPAILSRPVLWLGPDFAGLRIAAIFELSAERGKGRSVAERTPAAELCYGPRLNDTSCEAPYPSAGKRYVQLTETDAPHRWFGWDQAIEPSEGTIILNGFERLHAQGFARKEGTYLVINASDEPLLVQAAKALERLP